ncbi:Do family serine endopeptidase [Paraburkholderia sp. BL10I2N1]|uniref:Do family serine endopeptidase n=1 Tax=Paraburkholderia sp. BL10I2N1 TaxID=1938796 RepID=UPI00105B7959|nr:Do family serine endopeptidase [Paraburkholderia sp. BL10I2N1]TDN67126.1 serine protease Do [Paraburkholderia sp. BL10I2N1]
MNTRILSRGAMTLGAVAALAGAYAVGHRNADASQTVKSADTVTAPFASGARPGTPDFSDIVANYGPAVVHISAKHIAGQGDSQGQGADDRSSAALGSGFIISQDGYILTNNHVVDGANVVTVMLKDKREFPAHVIGTDKESDVAVLKIDAGTLPTVKIGDPAQSKVGEWVLAIGSPYGFDNTVTSGIISAKSRNMSDENYTSFIQTDVPVNPGNSGGPLFNMKGEVIGINSMIYSRTGGFQGLSFAIPIDEAIKVKDDLVKTGHVSRGLLGIGVGPIDQSAAKSLGMDKPQGALVGSVNPDGPAARAGIQTGDVILSVNGTPVTDASELRSRIAGLSPGATADIGVWRNGSRKSVSVTVGVMSGTKELPNAARQPAHARLGVAVRPLTQEELGEASLSSGLLVEQAQGPAAQAGIQSGDVILAVDGKRVASVNQLRQMISQAGDQVSLLIQRDGEQLSVPVELG